MEAVLGGAFVVPVLSVKIAHNRMSMVSPKPVPVHGHDRRLAASLTVCKHQLKPSSGTTSCIR